MFPSWRKTSKRLLAGAIGALAASFLFVQAAGAAPFRPDLPHTGVASAVRAVAQAAPPAGLAGSVDAWIGALAAQQPFAAWKQAVPRFEALGPGTHGWLVTLSDRQGRPVGYLIAYAAADGTYRLGEYGLGAQPLFDRTALTRSLVENGLLADDNAPYYAEKIYLRPFAAVWTVRIGAETYWADAKTTELLPLDPAQWQRQLAGGGDAAGADDQQVLAPQIAHWQLNELFDPYERLSWLLGDKPLGLNNDGELTARLDKRLHLRYVSEPFGDRMLYALPVLGYLQWTGGRIDLALGMDGTRFVPLSALRETGRFYP